MADHYQCLAISYQANANEIKRAYRSLALQNHPDKTLTLPSDERLAREVYFKAATDAYEILSDATKKVHYDTTPRTTEHKKPRRLLLKPYEKASASDSDSDQEERHRNAQAEYDRYFNSCLFAALAADLNVPELQAENMHTVSETNKMGYIFHRTFGEWTLELRISKLFNVCRTARPTELSPKDSLQQTQLHIRVALRAAEGIKLWDINTEEICVRITSAPGVVDRFETHFKERDDGICLLTIGLHASSLLSYRVCVAPVVELPIDVRLRTNWAPFGKQLNSKVRVTYMWFFGGHIGSPRTFVRYKDREMEGAEMVDVRDEGVRTVKCGWRFGRGRRR